jgi:hypothetical protein
MKTCIAYPAQIGFSASELNLPTTRRRMHADPKQALLRAYALIEKGLDSQAQHLGLCRRFSPPGTSLRIVYSHCVLLQKTRSRGKGCCLEHIEQKVSAISKICKN